MTDLIRDWLIDPTALLFLASLLLAVCCALSRSRSAGQLRIRSLALPVMIWIFLFLVCASPVVVNPLLRILEGRSVTPAACAPGSHVVVLSGGVDSRAQNAWHFEHLSDATMVRATAAWRLAQSEPQTRLLISGGTIGKVTEAEVVANFWTTMGVNPEQIIVESHSANTRENALNVMKILENQTVSGPVRLITSSLHMPRALRSFKKLTAETGMTICPISVGRLSLAEVPIWAFMPQTTALVKFDKWLHEIVALVIYRLRGWV